MKNFNSKPRWVAGKITTSIGNVSYEITLEDGRVFRRDIDHIRNKPDRLHRLLD